MNRNAQTTVAAMMMAWLVIGCTLSQQSEPSRQFDETKERISQISGKQGMIALAQGTKGELMRVIGEDGRASGASVEVDYTLPSSTIEKPTIHVIVLLAWKDGKRPAEGAVEYVKNICKKAGMETPTISGEVAKGDSDGVEGFIPVTSIPKVSASVAK